MLPGLLKQLKAQAKALEQFKLSLGALQPHFFTKPLMFD